MLNFSPAPGALVLYKIRPAIVVTVGEKIEIELEGGAHKRVRPKDITPLHPGPVSSFSQLQEPSGDLEEAWELLSEEEASLEDFSELVFGGFTPASAWFAWQLVTDGIYFVGTPEKITARPKDEVERDLAVRQAKIDEEAAWDQFISRLEQKKLEASDHQRLSEVERVALGTTANSKILKTLGYQESPQSAHKMLTKVGYWRADHNPYPARHKLAANDPNLQLPIMDDIERLDLTHLAAFAIDDEGSNDPDDAISLDGDRLWVHVADVSALVSPGSELDEEAKARGANLYVPEGIVHMLPPVLTQQLALGLHEESPALSISFRVGENGLPCDVELALSKVKVTRHTYNEIDSCLDQSPFAEIKTMMDLFHASRVKADAVSLDLPEVSVRVREGDVVIKPLERLGSRELVTEAMLMAGAAVAQYAINHEIPLPFATQPPPDKLIPLENLAEMYAFRRQLKPSRQKTSPEPHSGLGLEAYVRATSPLRRYLDLVTHQQIRAYLTGSDLLTVKQINERIAVSSVPAAAIRKAERQSNQHWKLVYLKASNNLTFDAVVVELNERKATLIIPGLALETKLRANSVFVLNQHFLLQIANIELEELDARFKVA